MIRKEEVGKLLLAKRSSRNHFVVTVIFLTVIGIMCGRQLATCPQIERRLLKVKPATVILWKKTAREKARKREGRKEMRRKRKGRRRSSDGRTVFSMSLQGLSRRVP